MNKSRINDVVVAPEKLNLEQPLGRFLIVLFRQFEDELIQTLHRKGYHRVTASDFSVLRHVDPKGISIVEIAELAGISKQAVSKTVQQLEREGLLKKQSDPNDLRAIKVVFTKKGTHLIELCIAIIRSIEKKYSKTLGGDVHLNHLKSILMSLIKNSL